MSDTQPQPTPTMAVSGNRNPKNLPVGPDGRHWSNGLYSKSGSWGTYCVSCWCPCITYGRVKRRYDHLQINGTPDPDHGGWLNVDCIAHGIISRFGFGFVLQFLLRGNIRERYNIEGGVCSDLWTAFCCIPCELTQESQELELEESTYSATSAQLQPNGE